MFKNKQVQKHYKRHFWSTEKKTDFRDVSTSAINGQRWKKFWERENKYMKQKKTTLKKTWVVAALACVCCLLWGSAIPVIKTGYRLMQIDSADTASQIVFAGVRFALAGILVLIFASVVNGK